MKNVNHINTGYDILQRRQQQPRSGKESFQLSLKYQSTELVHFKPFYPQINSILKAHPLRNRNYLEAAYSAAYSVKQN
jgi:hypothetical protein